MKNKTGFELLFSNDEEGRERTEEEKEQRDREFNRLREERYKREQRRKEDWLKSEREKAEKIGERYAGHEGAERWILSHL